MFHQFRFPSEALNDVRALVKLTPDQLNRLAKLLDSDSAAPPVDEDFEARVAKELDVTAAIARSAVNVSVVMQSLDLTEAEAGEIVIDLEHFITVEGPDDSGELLAEIDSKRKELIAVGQRTKGFSRELEMRRIASGTQPEIDAIRTLVQLRPLYERNESNQPVSIECLVPAMTLELKFYKNERSDSATFSLSESTLNELIRSLEDARNKWKIMKNDFADRICE